MILSEFCLFMMVFESTENAFRNEIKGSDYIGYVLSQYVFILQYFRDLQQVGGFLQVLRFPPPIKLTATI